MVRTTFARRPPLVALAAAGLLLVGCHRGPGHVHFVLPQGYRGPFKVVVTPGAESGYQLAAGRYVLTVPEDGALKIGDAWPFQRRPAVTAQYADGDQVPTGDQNAAPDDALRLVPLGQTRNERWWVVGNAGETSFIERLWDDGALPTLNVMLGPAWPSRPGELKPLSDEGAEPPK